MTIFLVRAENLKGKMTASATVSLRCRSLDRFGSSTGMCREPHWSEGFGGSAAKHPTHPGPLRPMHGATHPDPWRVQTGPKTHITGTTAAVTTTRSTLKIEHPSRGPGSPLESCTCNYMKSGGAAALPPTVGQGSGRPPIGGGGGSGGPPDFMNMCKTPSP